MQAITSNITWNWNSRQDWVESITQFQNTLYENTGNTKTEFKRMGGLALAVSDLFLSVVKLVARIAESIIKGIGNLFKGLIEGNFSSVSLGIGQLLTTPAVIVGSSILFALSVASFPLTLPIHMIWCAIDPEKYCDKNVEGINWNWQSRTQLADWINQQTIQMYMKVHDSQSVGKKAAGLPLIFGETLLLAAQTIAWTAEPIIKGVGNIIGCFYLGECRLTSGIRQLIQAPFIAGISAAVLGLNVAVFPLNLLAQPIIFAMDPDRYCNQAIRRLSKW